jgi:hypothetical protein
MKTDWIKSSERLPTHEDAFGFAELVWYQSMRFPDTAPMLANYQNIYSHEDSRWAKIEVPENPIE